MDLYNFSKPTSAQNTRFETGRRLSPQEKQEVLRSMGDVYQDADLQKDEIKGYDRYSGDPVYGYPFRPDLFITSDITGKQIRHYVTLPNGKKAHPTELFPNITKSEIDKEAFRQEAETRKKEERNQSREKRIADNKSQANGFYHITNRPMEGSYFMGDDQGRIVRVDGSDQEDVYYYTERGFLPISSPVQKMDLSNRQ